MRPQDVGIPESNLVLGKHSGRHAFSSRLKQLGYTLKAAELEIVFVKFKELADKKKTIFDDDIIALVEEGTHRIHETFTLVYMNASSGTGTIPTATVRISKHEKGGKAKLFQEASCGDGPVDAIYKAVDKVTGLKPQLSEYSLRAISGGKDAQGEVSVKVMYKGILLTGRGTSTDIIEASAKAYINASNKIISRKNFSKGKKVTL